MQAFNINKAEAQKILQIKSETESKSLHRRIQNMFIFILGELRQWFQSKINLLTPAVSSTLLKKHLKEPQHTTQIKRLTGEQQSLFWKLLHIKILFRIALLNFIIIKSDGLHLREKSSSV